MLTASDYAPPRWLRNAHIQSVLGSSPLRRRNAERRLAQAGARSELHLLETAGGVRLQGLHSAVPGTTPRGLVLLLHGWEGSAESNYMRLTAARLLGRGFEVFRLNFRDHGDTHHLNEGLFHSNRLEEVVQAAQVVAERFPLRPLSVAGYSLGGNFALRLALRASEIGLPLAHAAAVCPCWIRRARWSRWKPGCRCTCGTSSANGAARWRASANCFRPCTISTTAPSACACAR